MEKIMSSHPETSRVIDLITEVATANGVTDFDPAPFTAHANTLLNSGWFMHEVLAFARYFEEVTPTMSEADGLAGMARCHARAASRIAAH